MMKRYKISYQTMWRNIKEYIMSELIYKKNRKKELCEIKILEIIYSKIQEEELERKDSKYESTMDK